MNDKTSFTADFTPKVFADLMDKPPSNFVINPGQSFSRATMRRLLESYAPATGQEASCVYLRAGDGKQFLMGHGTQGQDWWKRLDSMDRTILGSDTGLVALRTGSQGLVVLPPFPILESKFSSAWDEGPLLSLLETEYTIGVVLLRLGRFSVAMYQGDWLMTSKTDARYVKGRHHAGGTSQKRFQRIREGQVHRLYGKTCEAVKAQLGPFAEDINYIMLGGDRFTLDGFQKECTYLKRWTGKILGRRLNVRDPKRDTLEEVAGMLSECQVYPFEW